MKIFISWSGNSSREYATALHGWIPSVLQNVQAYMSSHDIDKGERWLSSIFKSLEEIDFGIVVVTPENVDAPWIQFESGALSKNLERSRLVPILCGITDLDLSKNPLSTFQYVKNDRDGIYELVRAINSNLDITLPSDRIEKTFELWWSDFENGTKGLKFDGKRKMGQGRDGEVDEPHRLNERVERIEGAIDEILYSVRGMRSSPSRNWPHRVEKDMILEEIRSLETQRKELGDLYKKYSEGNEFSSKSEKNSLRVRIVETDRMIDELKSRIF